MDNLEMIILQGKPRLSRQERRTREEAFGSASPLIKYAAFCILSDLQFRKLLTRVQAM
jgi:hypothetical protein